MTWHKLPYGDDPQWPKDQAWTLIKGSMPITVRLVVGGGAWLLHISFVPRCYG